MPHESIPRLLRVILGKSGNAMWQVRMSFFQPKLGLIWKFFPSGAQKSQTVLQPSKWILHKVLQGLHATFLSALWWSRWESIVFLKIPPGGEWRIGYVFEIFIHWKINTKLVNYLRRSFTKVKKIPMNLRRKGGGFENVKCSRIYILTYYF